MEYSLITKFSVTVVKLSVVEVIVPRVNEGVTVLDFAGSVAP